MIKSWEHVGISVRSLEASMRFYCGLLGLERVGEIERFEGPLYEKIMGLQGASGRVALLKSADVQIELFEFASPPARVADSRRPVCDHGITHFAIKVADIQSAYAGLRAAGVPFHCEPLDMGGIWATYGRDPDGNVFELVELPR